MKHKEWLRHPLRQHHIQVLSHRQRQQRARAQQPPTIIQQRLLMVAVLHQRLVMAAVLPRRVQPLQSIVNRDYL